MSKSKYAAIDYVPSVLRWDIPAQNQGQTVEVAYAATSRHHEAHDGGRSGQGAAPYKRVTDYSIAVGIPGRVTYYARVAS